MITLTIVGNVVRDAMIRKTDKAKDSAGNPTTFVNFRVAAEKDKTKAAKDGKKNTQYFDVVLTRSFAEAIGQYITSGRKVLVQGPVELESYIRDNKAVYHNVIKNPEHFEFLDSKPVAKNEPEDFTAAEEEPSELDNLSGEDMPF